MVLSKMIFKKYYNLCVVFCNSTRNMIVLYNKINEIMEDI